MDSIQLITMVSKSRSFRFPVSVLIGSSSANILRILQGHLIDLKYFPKFILTFLISLFFKPFNILEKLSNKRKLKNFRMEEPPVFIIGFWRSGTTLLHSLLCQDPNAGYVTTFHGVFPNLVLIRQKWLKALVNRQLPKKRPFDNYSMDMDYPQEEEFAMMSLQPVSFYKFFYFPKDFKNICQKELHFEKLPEKQRNTWIKKYNSLIARAMLNTGGKRFVSKNPCNIFRIKTLAQLFPNARFIFIYRNPYRVVESLYRFVHEILPGSELQHPEEGIPREHFAMLYNDALQEYLRAKEYIKSGNLIEIKYEEFKDHPIEFIRDIYVRFNIPGIEEALPHMETYFNNNKPDTRRSYQVYRDTYSLVNDYAKDIVDRFGYQIIGVQPS